MIQVVLSAAQLRTISLAGERVAFVDESGRVVGQFSKSDEEVEFSTIPEMIEALSDPEISEIQLKEILDNYKPVGTLHDFLQRVATTSKTRQS